LRHQVSRKIKISYSTFPEGFVFIPLKAGKASDYPEPMWFKDTVAGPFWILTRLPG